MKIKHLLFVALLAASCCRYSADITVYPRETAQTIEHFGASDAWNGQFVGAWWNEDAKESIAEKLFSTDFDENGNPKGIGLSLWRANLGAGSLEREGADIIPFQNRAECYLDADGNYDWNKCRGMEYFIQKATERGAQILLFSNSPLVRWTLNGKGHTDLKDRANLKPESYPAFAGYLADVACHLRDKGYDIRYISPINEPSVDWVRTTQEGSSWRRSEIVKMTAALDSAMSLHGELDDVKIYLSEAASLAEAYGPTEGIGKQFGEIEDRPDNIIPTLYNPRSEYSVLGFRHVEPVIGIHEYHSNKTFSEMREKRAKLDSCLRQNGVIYHMSEWCLLSTYRNKVEGFPEQIDDYLGDINVALLIGRMMHADFAWCAATSWSYWKAMDSRLGALIHLTNGENVYQSAEAEPQKIFWGIGNFSFFVRPGYRFVNTEGGDDLGGVCATSFISPCGKRLVTVFVNTGAEDAVKTLDLGAAFNRRLGKASTYVTSAEYDLQLVSGLVKKQGSITVPARSLVTLVVDR